MRIDDSVRAAPEGRPLLSTEGRKAAAMHHNDLDYWRYLQGLTPGDPELPSERVCRQLLRTMGQWTRKLRGMAAEFQNQFNEAMQLPDDPAKPVWWWCDALFMAPSGRPCTPARATTSARRPGHRRSR